MTRTPPWWLGLALTTMLILTVSGCATAPEPIATDSEQGTEPDFDFSDARDPFEDFNRKLWDWNRETLDPMILLPLANTYEKVPSGFRQSIYSFTDNLNEPVNFINNVLQLKMRDAGISITRFAMNSSLGFLGFFDVATSVGITEQKESFGETLATYGVPQGPYIMLPGIGPTVAIDRGGDLADSVLWPNLIYGWHITVAKYVLRGLSQRIELKQLEPMLENSIDEYSFVREAYFSYWLDKVFDGNVPADSMWDDPWDSDWDDEWKDEWDDQDGFNPSAAVEYNSQSWQQIKREFTAPH